MDAKFYKSLNLLSKNFSQKLKKSKNILILFDENVDGFFSALIFLNYFKKSKIEVDWRIYRRNGFEEIRNYDMLIILDIPITRSKISKIKWIKNVFWIDDQKPKTFTFKKSNVINSYLFKVSLSTSSLCYFFFQNLLMNKEIIFLSYLGSLSEFYKNNKLEERFNNYFYLKNAHDIISSIHYFIRKEKERKIEKLIESFLDKGISTIIKKYEMIFPKVNKIYKKLKISQIVENFEYGLTKIASDFIYEKLKRPVIVSSSGEKREVTIRAPQEIINEIKINNLEEYEFFVMGVEFLTDKKEYIKIKEKIKNAS